MGKKMGETTVDERGRLIIPKKVREDFSIRKGEKIRFEEKDGELVLKVSRSEESLKELKGCVKESKIDPMDAKNIWEA